MQLSSMTGFARTNGEFIFENKKYSWVWEIKSVNAKGIDIKLRIPFWLENISEEIKSVCSKSFARGTFNVCLDINSQNLCPDVQINSELLDVLTAKIKQIYLAEPELFTKPSPADLLKINGVLKISENVPSEEEFEALKNRLLKSLSEATAGLKQDRIKEGEKIAEVLNNILINIKHTVETVDKIVAQNPQKLKEKFLSQVTTLLEDNSVSPERIEQEIVLLVMKADVQEEIDRLYAHIKTAHELLKSAEPVGRRLDFLCQELNREANTLCSKSCDIEQTKYGMELKALIEQFREQVQNME
ncbi:MAG: YicC family protein [Alphaproteobacteria bacterium]|nr:YicC family protein [Alphaproteobacteria bacterium]